MRPGDVPAPKLARETVSVPAWDATVDVHQLPAGDLLDGRDGEDYGYTLIVKSVRYDDGSPIFEGVEQVKAYPVDVVDTLVAAALRVNGIGESAAEDAAGKSEGTLSNGSASP